MNDWQKGLDRYLTSEPVDNFTPWCEAVGEHYTDEFWDENEKEFVNSELENKWLQKLQNKVQAMDYNEKTEQMEMMGYMTPELAAAIIMRAHRRFCKQT